MTRAPNDFFQNPYSADSPHHRPIGTGARYAPDNDPSTNSLMHSNFTTVNIGLPWGNYIIQTDQGQPLRQITAHPGANGLNLPLSLRFAQFVTLGPVSGNYYDNIVIIVDVPSLTVYVFSEFVWLSGGDPQAAYCKIHALDGIGTDGIGASRINGMLGITRGFELADPNREIGHVMQFTAMSQTTSSDMKNQYVWPARGTDSFCDGTTSCVGAIPYGSLWALPQSVYTDDYINNSMGLSAMGKRLARQLRNYGGYFVDGANGRPSRGDQDITAALQTEHNTQMKLIYPHLRMILNNVQTDTYVAGGGTAIAPNTAWNSDTIPIQPPVTPSVLLGMYDSTEFKDYALADNTARLNDYAARGWNLMVNYGSFPSNGTLREMFNYADLCHERGIKLMWEMHIQFSDVYWDTSTTLLNRMPNLHADVGGSNNQQFVINLINQLKTHPATFAYYIADEPDTSTFPRHKYNAQVIKTADPGSTHWVTLTLGWWYADNSALDSLNSPYIDLIGMDYYPYDPATPTVLPNNPGEWDNMTNRIAQVNAWCKSHGKKFFGVPQAFGFDAYNCAHRADWPPEDVMKRMNDIWRQNGSELICLALYSYFDDVKSDCAWTRPANYLDMVQRAFAS